jgi:hypothetical protein
MYELQQQEKPSVVIEHLGVIVQQYPGRRSCCLRGGLYGVDRGSQFAKVRSKF